MSQTNDDAYEQSVLREYLKFKLGVKSEYFRVIPAPNSIQDMIFKEVQSQIGDCFSIFFVKNGLPEVFFEKSFTPIPVIYSRPYILQTEKIRTFFTDMFEGQGLTEITQHVALKLVAEMSLKYGDADFAVLAFAKAMTNTGIITYEDDDYKWEDFQRLPMNETYMIAMFFALVHELGHLWDIQEQFDVNKKNNLYSDQSILYWTQFVVSRFTYPDFIKQEALNRATNDSSSIMNIKHLRREVRSDIFAIETLLHATLKLQNNRLDIIRFISEIYIYSHIIGIIKRCQNLSIGASSKVYSYEASIECDLQPISIGVRIAIQSEYFKYVITNLVYGENPSHEEFVLLSQDIDKIQFFVEQRVAKLDEGLAKVNKFCKFPEQREEESTILETFRQNLIDPLNLVYKNQTERFCDLAYSFKKNQNY